MFILTEFGSLESRVTILSLLEEIIVEVGTA
jgi:hypothetical protein